MSSRTPPSNWAKADESGIAQVEHEITAPSGLVTALVCGDPDPASGQGSCFWDATGPNGGVRPADGNEFTVRLRAADGFGQASPCGRPQAVRVDAQPPTELAFPVLGLLRAAQ